MDCRATALAEPVVYVQLGFGRHACSMGLAASHEVTTQAWWKSDLFARAIELGFLQIQACIAIFDDQKLEA